MTDPLEVARQKVSDVAASLGVFVVPLSLLENIATVVINMLGHGSEEAARAAGLAAAERIKTVEDAAKELSK